MPVMRIAVAGTGGLGCLIAHYITEETSHQVVLLSRTVRLHTLHFGQALRSFVPHTLARLMARCRGLLYHDNRSGIVRFGHADFA